MAHPNNPYVRRAAGAAPSPRGRMPQLPEFRPQGSGAPQTRTASSQQRPQPTAQHRASVSPQGAQHAGTNGEFNPQAFGGWRSSVQAAMGSKSRMFNDQGTLNANDKRDALTQIAHLLQGVSKTASSREFFRTAESQMDKQARMQILAAAMQDPTGEGFAIVGQELLLPIKDIVDYEGWARKVYRTRPLAQGELFRMAKDVRATAWVVGQDGQSLEARLYGKYIQPSEFKVTSFPTVDIEEIYQMNYDVLDRAQDTARQEIELNEDKRALALLDQAASTVNSVTIFSTLGISAFEDVRFQVERNRLIVEKFLIARQELSDIVKTMSTAVDPVTERELILAGYVGNVLNAQIITNAGTGAEEVVLAGTFYAVTGSEYLGEMGIRIELFSEPFNMYAQQRLVKGWAFGELIGFGISNPRSVAKGTK